MNLKLFLVSSLLIISLYAQPNCQAGETAFGNQCFTNQDLQDCYDHLGTLNKDERYDPDNGLLGSISNECTADLSAAGEYTYTFNLNYHPPYFHNANCHTHEIYYTHPYDPQNHPFVEIPESTGGLFDQYTFTTQVPGVNNNFSNGVITYTINHEDLTDPYMCDYFEEEFEYIWVCQMELHILMGGVIQYVFPYHLTIILPRVTDAEITTTVQRNANLGECCKNTLDIDSDLCFCEDHTCDPQFEGPCFSNQTQPYLLERNQIFFVRHFITTEEFKFHYLENIEIMIGPFVPEVLDYDNSVPGQIIFKLKSNVALDLMTLKVTSLIHDNNSNSQTWQNTSRRQLPGFSVIDNQLRNLQTFNEDYFMQNTIIIQTVEPEIQEEEKTNSTDGEEDNANIIKFGLLALYAIIFLIM